MKPLGVISTAGLLFVLLGAAAFGYTQHEQQGEKQPKHEEQAKPEKQQDKQRQDQNKQQHAQQQRQDQNRQQHAQQQRNQQQRRTQQREQRGAWQQRRAHSWESEHRTWQQRGGYTGYRIPDNHFRRYYGRGHWFRIYSLPFMMEGGYPRFQYGGYWFNFVDPYPEYWGNSWYQTDDVYVDYFGDGYYLYNRRYPGRPGVAVSISF